MKQFILTLGHGAGSVPPPLEEQLILPNVTYPNDPGYIDTDVLDVTPTANYQWAPSVYTIQDKTFIRLMSTDATFNRQYIVVYDHFRNKMSGLIDTGLVFGTGDSHHQSAIYPTGDGRLFLMANQRLSGSNKRTWISRCATGYDVTNWDSWEELNTEDYEYPHLQTFPNGDIYSIMRDYDGNWLGFVYYSDDNAETWSNINEFIDMASANDERPYPLQVWSEDNVLRVFINHIRNYDANQFYLYYMESYDGGFTWQNIDNTYSQDTTSNALNISELQNNFTALYVDGGYIRANYATTINGVPYALGGVNSNWDMGIVFWNGSVWVSRQITCPGHVIAPSQTSPLDNYRSNGCVLKESGGTLFLYTQEIVSGNTQVSLFTSTDNGINWVFDRQVTSEPHDHWTARHNMGSGYDVLVTNVDKGTNGGVFIEKIN